MDKAGRKARARRDRRRAEAPIPWWTRLLLLLAGWLLVLIGVAGLVLPGIQGVLTIFAGAAVLSLVSEAVYDLLRWSFSRWPKGWRRVVRLRRRLHRWLTPAQEQ
ncbi:MAG: hypothetical protein KDD47_27650 [Acidobacteria bacterium]|nr:hypothetical protein [Acidobacteriota bacterium]